MADIGNALSSVDMGTVLSDASGGVSEAISGVLRVAAAAIALNLPRSSVYRVPLCAVARHVYIGCC